MTARLQENRAQRGVRKYREKIDRFLKNVLFQADGRERLGLQWCARIAQMHGERVNNMSIGKDDL